MLVKIEILECHYVFMVNDARYEKLLCYGVYCSFRRVNLYFWVQLEQSSEDGFRKLSFVE